ncbi:inorganic pyrophosphatase [Thermospira aquatica]|uniref:inorganic diphosphatase n=1 Tax=Thermospira aquatica TaxID=2828656 RepID=A0AAX3BAI0_9SPIR|nr:inorganic pyrophosphatase [Thermospira aquatica]URA09269.1 inorganic pyrophosphatase [Thermospira aquatica]
MKKLTPYCVFRAHPWHGIAIGDDAPKTIPAYIELVPSDTVKYELDKETGILKVDRPQLYSSVPPMLYGFIPQTLCAEKIAEFCQEKTNRSGIVGDMDPLDICVLSEKTLFHGDILLHARPIGGIRMIDHGEADDKIVAVLLKDAVYDSYQDIYDLPPLLLDRIVHYFLTYKNAPDNTDNQCEVTHVYGQNEAHEVIRRSHEDYLTHYQKSIEASKAWRQE